MDTNEVANGPCISVFRSDTKYKKNCKKLIDGTAFVVK